MPPMLNSVRSFDLTLFITTYLLLHMCIKYVSAGSANPFEDLLLHVLLLKKMLSVINNAL